MSLFRQSLPQLSGRFFLSDGGIETSLIFHDGWELPDFAAFHLLRNPQGREAVKNYFRPYVELAKRHNTGLILESATWRASADWAHKLGYEKEELAALNRDSVVLLEELRTEMDAPTFVISGCIGPRGDGYVPSAKMTAKQAADYHRAQVETFASTAADLVTAITMNYVDEAIGIVSAARDAGMPAVVAFTVETDGTLPSGESLGDAIREVDAATGSHPAYFMINCAHPEHFDKTLYGGSDRWVSRIRGLRANASRMSHAELNESPVLDPGNPEELARQYAELHQRFPHMTVMGGCCGTDHRHIGRIAEACTPFFSDAGKR